MVGKRHLFVSLGLILSFCLIGYLAGCGGSSSHPVGVTVTAAASTVDGTNSVTLTATVTNDKNGAGVTWSLSGAGTLSNKTATSATYTAPAATSSAQTATITVTSAADTTKTASVTITIAAMPNIATTNTDLASQVGATYLVTLKVTGGIPPYTWSLTSGTLPSCLTLNASTGVISGTVTAACAGSYDLTFEVTDSGTPNKLTATESLTIVINGAPAIVLPASIQATAVAGTAYTASVAATGGAGALTYSITSGTLPAGLALNASTGAITGTPTTAGASTFTIKAADAFGDTPATQSYTITVGGGPATHFAVTAASGNVTAGGTVNFTVTALDANGNTANGYAGTVKFTSSDTNAALPANSTLTKGAGSFQATLKTAGSQTITATDSATATITGTTASITVTAAAASKLSVSAPATATAGTAINVSVTAQDAYGNTVTDYAGTVALTSTDSAAVLPANSTLSSGVKTFSVTLKTAGDKTITATDTATATITGTSATIKVSAGAATKLIVSAPGTANAGTAIGFSVTAQDAYGNTATGYTGTVKFTSSDANAALPANSTLTNGAGTFQATLKTAGPETITATDTATASITGSTGTITVSPAAVTKLAVSAPSKATAGTAFNVTVTAQDAFGNTISSYAGTVALTSSDAAAVLPANSTLTNGAKTFSVTLKSSGSQTVTATDTGNAAITGTSAAITVDPASATKLVVTAPSAATAGTAISVAVTAKDVYGNTVTGYAGTVAITSTDHSAVLPANSTLTNGVGTFQVTLKSMGSQEVTATDTVTASITGTSGVIAVSAATASHFSVSLTSSATISAGGTVNFMVNALDAYGNTATTYAGLVKFTSTDTAASLPGTTTLANGVGGFIATLKTSGSQTITATDTVTASITGTSSAITVNPGAASKLAVVAPGTVTTNLAFNFTVTAQDAYNNTVPSFADTVHFTSSDASAVLPGNAGLPNGTGSFSATLKTDGNQTITATDVANGAISGVSAAINVTTKLTITTNVLPAGNVGAPYSQPLNASGGTGSGYTWTATNSNLSTFGLSLSTAGVVSGTPSQSGNVSFTANVKDSGNNTATQGLAFQVYGGLTLPAGNSLPAGYINEPYNQSVTGNGGSSNLTIAITSALSPANGTLALNASGSTVTISGTPTTATSESFTVTLTDNTTHSVVSQTYHFTISTPTYVLPAQNPPAATVGLDYSASITANIAGGSGTYVWLINGSQIASNGSPTALGGSGLAAQFYASDTGGDTLLLSTASGTPPSSTGSFQFNAQIKDTVTGLTSSSQSYTLQVNSAGATISGNVSLYGTCGLGSLPTISVSINTTPVKTVQTDNNGNFSFTGIGNGSYTITPSLFNPPSGAGAIFAPATTSVTVTNGADVSGLSIQAQVAYTVSGAVAYIGNHAGRTYINLVNTNCGGNGGVGTSVNDQGNFTISGVAPGSYTLKAWMDPSDPLLNLGEGIQNASDPTGSISVNVDNGNFTGANVDLVDGTPGTPASGPQLKAIYPTHNGLMISSSPVTDSNGMEVATSYKVAWSTSPTLSSGSLASVAGTFSFKALGNSPIWFLNNAITGSSSFTDGQTYYFEAQAVNSAGTSAWTVYGGSSPTGVTIGGASGANTVSGKVTIPTGITIGAHAQMYVGFYGGKNGVYATQLSSPIVGDNSYSVTVPTGTWQFFVILDQNDNGEVDAGDLTNVADSPPTVSISGNTTENLALPGGNSSTVLSVRYSQQTYWNGMANQNWVGYALDFRVGQNAKLPVAVTLTSGPNIIAPVNIGNYCQNCSQSRFEYQPSLFTSTSQPPLVPSVGDTYKFTVTYSDGTTDSNVTAAVTGWNNGSAVVGASNAPNSLSPTGTGASTQPNFSWSDPASSQGSGFIYFFGLQGSNCAGNCEIWQIPGDNSNSNGFSSSITSITWGTDPTGGGSMPTVGSLTVGDQYNWSIQVQDSNRNQASTQTWLQP
jgi:hypothetical protein